MAESVTTRGSPWRTVGAIASQTAALAAILFYFGWASAGATFGYFGVDLSLLGFATSDFLLRSIYSAFQPLLLVGLVAVGAVVLHQTLLPSLERRASPRVSRRLPVALLGVGVIVALAAVLGLVLHPVTRLLGQSLPAALAVGALLCSYADHLWPLLRRRGALHAEDSARRLRTFLLVSIALLGAFWWIALYAVDTGEDRAAQLADDLRTRTEVALYATRPLSIAGPGVGRDVFPGAQLKYRYRYTGLRLLIRAGGDYFLLPRDWVRGRDSVYAIPQGDGVRLEFISGA